MNAYQQYISTLSEDELRVIIENYERFELSGVIGDEPLRKHAETLMAQLGVTSMVVLIMERVAFEAYRHFAELHLKEQP